MCSQYLRDTSSNYKLQLDTYRILQAVGRKHPTDIAPRKLLMELARASAPHDEAHFCLEMKFVGTFGTVRQGSTLSSAPLHGVAGLLARNLKRPNK